MPIDDSVFLDTNILVYAHTDLEITKQTIAQSLIRKGHSYISTQVLQELSNTLNKKFKHSWEDIADVIADATAYNMLHINDENTIRHGCNIASRYGYSFYDSMIIAAAIDSKCNLLYSEDLHDGQLIDGVLKIKNPFK